MNPGGQGGGEEGWGEAGSAPGGWADSSCCPSCADCSINISAADRSPEERRGQTLNRGLPPVTTAAPAPPAPSPRPGFGPIALPWPAAQPICPEPTSQLALQGPALLPGPDLNLDFHRVHGVGFDAISPDVLPAIRPHAWEGALGVLFLPSRSLAALAPECPQPQSA